METTTIVAGVARSGLTLTMQILEAGGATVAGSWPYEPYGVGDIPWRKVRGQAVKLVDAHLQLPPVQAGPFRVVLLQRRLVLEQAKSQVKFLRWSTGSKAFNGPVDLEGFAKSIDFDFSSIALWAKQQEACLRIEFESLVAQPARQVARLAAFLARDDFELDRDVAAAVVIPRPIGCLPFVLEERIAQQQRGWARVGR